MLPDLIIPMAMAGPWIPPSPRGRTKDAYLFIYLFIKGVRWVKPPIISLFVTRFGTSKEITSVGDPIAAEEGGRRRFKPIALSPPKSKNQPC